MSLKNYMIELLSTELKSQHIFTFSGQSHKNAPQDICVYKHLPTNMWSNCCTRGCACINFSAMTLFSISFLQRNFYGMYCFVNLIFLSIFVLSVSMLCIDRCKQIYTNTHECIPCKSLLAHANINKKNVKTRVS